MKLPENCYAIEKNGVWYALRALFLNENIAHKDFAGRLSTVEVVLDETKHAKKFTSQAEIVEFFLKKK
jgi:hypothetical protein